MGCFPARQCAGQVCYDEGVAVVEGRCVALCELWSGSRKEEVGCLGGIGSKEGGGLEEKWNTLCFDTLGKNVH